MHNLKNLSVGTQVMVTVGVTSIVTWVVVAPGLTVLIVPGI